MRRPRPQRGISIAAILVQMLPVALLILVFAAVGVVHVTSRVLVVHAGYRMSQLEVESRSLAREHDQLRLERATLLSPSRLEKVAREQLGLVPPPAGSVIAARPAGGAPFQLHPATDKPRTDEPTAVRVANRGGR